MCYFYTMINCLIEKNYFKCCFINILFKFFFSYKVLLTVFLNPNFRDI